MLYYIEQVFKNRHPMQAKSKTGWFDMEKVAAMELAEKLAGKGAKFFQDGPGVMGYVGEGDTFLVVQDNHNIQF